MTRSASVINGREGSMSTTTQDTGTEGLVEQAKSELGDVASNVQDKAVELKEQGRGKLGETLDRRTTEVGGQARQAAQVLRQSGSQMLAQAEGNGQQVAHFAEVAADRVEQLGGYLERTSGDQLLRDAEEFARRRPWMVAGFGLVAGLAASRFLKASSERRYGAPGSSSAGRYSYSTGSPSGAYQPPTRAGVVSGA
jgi:ElaB/YqjD/DUF883 family membrane-anchored ribosome-binding protein